MPSYKKNVVMEASVSGPQNSVPLRNLFAEAKQNPLGEVSTDELRPALRPPARFVDRVRVRLET